MTAKFDNLSLQHLIRKENEGRTAKEERTLRIEHLLSVLERRLTDLELVIEEQLESRSMVSTIPPHYVRQEKSSYS